MTGHRRRLLAAALLALVSLGLLLGLGNVPEVQYREGLVLAPAGTVLKGAELEAAWAERFGDPVVSRALAAASAADPAVKGWTPDRVRRDIRPELRDDGVTFLVCHTADTSCRTVLDALATEWTAPNAANRYGVEDPDHATSPRSVLRAAQLLLGAGGLVLASLLAAGLLGRPFDSLRSLKEPTREEQVEGRFDTAWRLTAAAFCTVAAMRQGAFDGVLPNSVWQGILLLAYLVLAALTLVGRRAPLRSLWPANGPRRLLVVGLGAVSLAALASTAVSASPRWTLVQAAILTLALLVVALTATLRWTDADTRDDDVDTLVVTWAALLGAGLVASVTGASWPGNPTGGRFQSFLYNPNVAGLLAATLGVVAVARVLQRRRAVPMAVVAVVMAATVALSGSRGALLATVAGLVVVGWAWGRWRAAAGALVLAVLGGVALVVATRGREGGLSRLGGVFADSGRLPLWREAVARWAEHPVLGNGYRSGTDESVAKTLHNLYLSVLAELGVVGVAALLVVAAAVVWGTLRTRRPWLAGGALALAVAEVFDSTMVGFLGPVALTGWLLIAAVASGARQADGTRIEAAPAGALVDDAPAGRGNGAHAC